MEQASGTRLDLDQVEAAIRAQFDQAVTLQAQTARLSAETMTLSAELAKRQHEHRWYRLVAAATLTAAVMGATSALTKLLIGA